MARGRARESAATNCSRASSPVGRDDVQPDGPAGLVKHLQSESAAILAGLALWCLEIEMRRRVDRVSDQSGDVRDRPGDFATDEVYGGEEGDLLGVEPHHRGEREP